MTIDDRLRAADRAADARARLYAREIRARLATFEDERLSATAVKQLLSDVRAICDRMDVPCGDGCIVLDLRDPQPIGERDFAQLFEFPTRPAS